MGRDNLLGRDKINFIADFKNFEIGKNIRLPLPQVEVENNPNMEQNPQY